MVAASASGTASQAAHLTQPARDAVAFTFRPRHCIVEALNLAFATKSLRSLCEAKSLAERELGPKTAATLRRRLADLRAAENVADLIAIGLAEASEFGPELRFNISGGTLLVHLNHQDAPLDRSGRVDWKRVTRVKVITIEGAS